MENNGKKRTRERVKKENTRQEKKNKLKREEEAKRSEKWIYISDEESECAFMVNDGPYVLCRFSRLRNSQFDAFVSNFVHEFNWFLIRSIYSCHVSLIIIGQAICSALTDWLIWLKYFNTKGLWVRSKWFHVDCISISHSLSLSLFLWVIDWRNEISCFCRSFALSSLTTNGTFASAEVFPFIESTHKKKKTQKLSWASVEKWRPDGKRSASNIRRWRRRQPNFRMRLNSKCWYVYPGK